VKSGQRLAAGDVAAAATEFEMAAAASAGSARVVARRLRRTKRRLKVRRGRILEGGLVVLTVV